MITLKEIYDPRTPWAKARRWEVHKWGIKHGITLDEAMPKDLMVRKLQAAGVPPPTANFEILGGAQAPSNAPTVEVDATDLLQRQWEAKSSIDKMNFNQLRAELRARGITWNRRWKADDIRAVLNGKNTA